MCVGPITSEPPKAGVRAAVADVAGPQPDDPSVPGQPEFGELHLAAALHRQHRLAAGLRPGDRAAEQPGGGDDRAVGVGDAGLAAEGTADVGGDHPHLALLQAGELHEQVARQVRLLGRDVRRQLDVAGRSRVGQDRVALERCGGDPLVLDPGAHHHLGAGKHVARVVGVDRVDGLGDVGAQLGELQRRAGRQRRLHVDHQGQLVVVDVDQLGGVDRLRSGLGHHQRDRVAHVAHHAVRQRGVTDPVVDHRERWHRGGAECRHGVHGEHAGCALGFGGVDAADPGVRDRAAHEDGLRGPRDPQVVDVRAAPREQLGVLDPADVVPEDRSDHDPQTTPGGGTRDRRV